ncbi:gamma-glutamyltranspeptidase [Capsaspora owczarzaki ATCC 30864]|uniref:Gamma-glutamyltranspeptidase n=1 Tax=Capsaspora owczarzaki (strain ATCC 30864) TaxID=595528 RepID=A0A0D2UNH5_CAPO3|nr:gamma-glutamyltranspeptidase [Capsaspora owczarzaki ATCC 30864]KJE96541.1 gamma-glutamyltranspeptidase [Capsaspora owczarzaki ATCC 30864]|eukprot:XP_004344469.1 gamma-glutamyltranspeptidase [Capsaspora owczarzaki ATCC 30864]
MTSLPFISRRSPVMGTHGMVSSSQPLATQIGIDILKRGGNAADAAIATAAALNVTEPCSTGIGGDMFCLFYRASTRTVHAVNGSGRSPAALTLQIARESCAENATCIPTTSAHAVTVPGAVTGWCDTFKLFGSGRLTMQDILTPAVELAQKGFPVSHITAHSWSNQAALLKSQSPGGADLLVDGRAPLPAELFRNPALAGVLKEIGARGAEAFYTGRVAEAIVESLSAKGGVMTLQDLQCHLAHSLSIGPDALHQAALHNTTVVAPISTSFGGLRVWECPPNGQGLIALIALNILEATPVLSHPVNSAEYLHYIIESLRLAFADGQFHITDPTKSNIPLDTLLSKEYGRTRAQLIRPGCVLPATSTGVPVNSTDTVYFSVVDGEGNACSFINSNYTGFGSCIVPTGTGFSLQSRGSNFSLMPNHPNVVAPEKRPYHTIIPAMLTTDSGELYASYGVMGGFMQPQGHVQVLLNLLKDDNPQHALDLPRVCITPDEHGDGLPTVLLEEGIDAAVLQQLAGWGHSVQHVTGTARSVFGRGQVIRRLPTGVLVAGCDPRSDGMACGW